MKWSDPKTYAKRTEQLKQEVLSLVYLSLRLKRSLIIPNVLVEKVTDPVLLKELTDVHEQKSNKIQRPLYPTRTTVFPEEADAVDVMGTRKGDGYIEREGDVLITNTLWPGFRVLYLTPQGDGSNSNGEPVLKVQHVEPAYYWRITRDFQQDAKDSKDAKDAKESKDLKGAKASEVGKGKGKGTGTDSEGGQSASASTSGNSGDSVDVDVVPPPIVVSFPPHASMEEIEFQLASQPELSRRNAPRLVLHMLPDRVSDRGTLRGKAKMTYSRESYISCDCEKEKDAADDVNVIDVKDKDKQAPELAYVRQQQAKEKRWAEHSVGHFGSWEEEILQYQPLPSLSPQRKTKTKTKTMSRQAGRGGGFNELDDSVSPQTVVKYARLCKNIAERMRGNRSCFDKCD